MDPNSFENGIAAMTLNNNPLDLPDLLDSLPTEDLKPAPIKTKVSKFHKLAYGYVRYKPGATYAERQLYWQRIKFNPHLKDKLPRPPSDCWLFHNKNLLGKAVQLYASQVGKLVELLPEAYAALLGGDTTYFEVLSETKTLRLTLEVRYHKIKEQDILQLTLKKYYKPEDKADDEQQDWLPTSSHVRFDPDLDDPDDLLEYTLATSDS